MSNLVKVAAYTHRYEADLIAGKLEEEGIECVITEEMSNQVMNYTPYIAGGIGILVLAEDAVRAKEIIGEEVEMVVDEESEGNQGRESDDTEKEQIFCPVCGSDNVSIPRYSAGAMVFGMLLIGIPFAFTDKRRFCFECGAKFRKDK